MKAADSSILEVIFLKIFDRIILRCVILLVLKRFLTWFGNLKIFRILFPIDHFLAIHKFIGIYIIFLSFIHTIAHCVNQCNFL